MPTTNSELPSVVRTVRSTLRNTIRDAFESDHPVVVEALPASGKSRGVIQWASETGNPLTVLTGRHGLRDEYEEWAEEFGVTFGRVPSQRRDCPLGVKYVGEEIPADRDEWKEKYDEFRKQHVSDIRVHNSHPELPCQADGKCPYVEKYKQFDASDFDVVAGHYLHVYSTYDSFPYTEGKYIEDRYVAFDEFPAEDIVTTVSNYEDAITPFLARTPELPYDTFDELRVNVHMREPDNEEQILIDTWLEQNEGQLFDLQLAKAGENPNAPALARAALSLDWPPKDNGWLRAELGSTARVVMYEKNAYILRRLPTDTLTRSVIALDGTPSIEMWRILLGEDTEQVSVHGDDSRRREYIRDGLGIRFIQTSHSIKPYASAYYLENQQDGDEYIDDDSTARKDMLVFRWIARREAGSDQIGFVSTKKAIEVYDMHDLDEVVDARGHYGNLKGSNEYEDIRVGIVAGCNAPSNQRVQMWGAFADVSLKPTKSKNNKVLKGRRKSFGEYGDRIMAGLRENEVLQVAMRFARKPGRNQSVARVYLHTSALPEWLEPEQMILRPKLWEQTKGMGQVLTVIQDPDFLTGHWKTTDVVPAIGERFKRDAIEKRTVQLRLKDLRESHTVNYYRPSGDGVGSGRAYLYETPDAFNGPTLVHEDGYLYAPDFDDSVGTAE